MDNNDFLGSLNEKLKAGSVEDVKNDLVISGGDFYVFITRYVNAFVTCEFRLTLLC